MRKFKQFLAILIAVSIPFSASAATTESTAIIRGTKTWDDNNNEIRIRPDTITIHLYANGEDTGYFYTLSEETEWTYEFSGVPLYDDDGMISYSIIEDVPDGYTVSYSEAVITSEVE